MASPYCRDVIENIQFGKIKFGSKCLFGENDHLPLVFQVSEVLVSCKAILQSIVFLRIFDYSLKKFFFQFLFFLGKKFEFIFLNEI